MARMLALVQADKINRCCRNCCFPDGRFRHLGKDPKFRKWARAGDKAAWKKESSGVAS